MAASQDPVLGAIYGGSSAPDHAAGDPVLGSIYGNGSARAALPPAPKAGGSAKKGGGGVLGFLGHAAHDVAAAPMGAVKGVTQLGKDVAVAGARGVENIANDVAYGATGGTVGGADSRHLGSVAETPNFHVTHYDANGKPVGHVGISFVPTQSAVAERVKTAYPALEGIRAGMRQTASHVQGIPEVPGQIIGVGPTGAAHQLESDYSQHPLGSLLNDAANIALVTGAAPEGGVLGKVHGVSSAIAGAPFHAAGALASPLADLAAKTETGAKVIDALKQGRENAKGSKAVNNARLEGSVRAADFVRENERLMNEAGKMTPEEYAGSLLRTQGHAPLLERLAASPAARPVLEDVINKLGGGDAPVGAVEKALNPTEPVLAGEQALRGVSDLRTARNVEGYGQAPGRMGLNPEEVGTGPMPSAVQRLMDEGGVARAQAEQDLRALPAAIRTPIQTARETVSALEDAAKQHEADGNAASAAELRQVQQEIAPLTDAHYWENSPNAPAHIIGLTDKEMAGGAAPGGAPRGVFSKLKMSNYREGVSTSLTKEGQRSLEVDQLKKAAWNEGLKRLDAQEGASAAERGVTGTGPEIVKAMNADQPMRAWNPLAKTGQQLEVPAAQVTEATRFLPEPVFKALTKAFPQNEAENGMHAALKAGGTIFDKASRLVRSPVHFSPQFLARYVVGDAVMAAKEIPAGEFVQRALEARRMIAAGQEPAIFSHGINIEGPTDAGVLGRASMVLPRAIDKMARTMVFIQKASESGDYEAAAREANQAMGDIGMMSAPERNVLQRMLPVYSWAKTVAVGLGHMAADHPQATLYMLNLGRMASQLGWKPGEIATELNPMEIFSVSGGFLNPLIRAGVEGTTGINLTTGKQVGLPPDQAKKGYFLPGKDMAYTAAGQTPVGKLFLQSPLSGRDQNIGRYATGQPFISKGHTEKPNLPPVNTPVGTFGPYYRQLFGLPATPGPKTINPKTAQTKAKQGKKYAGVVKALAKRGVR